MPEWKRNYRGVEISRGRGPLDMPKWAPYVAYADGAVFEATHKEGLSGIESQIDKHIERRDQGQAVADGKPVQSVKSVKFTRKEGKRGPITPVRPKGQEKPKTSIGERLGDSGQFDPYAVQILGYGRDRFRTDGVQRFTVVEGQSPTTSGDDPIDPSSFHSAVFDTEAEAKSYAANLVQQRLQSGKSSGTGVSARELLERDRAAHDRPPSSSEISGVSEQERPGDTMSAQAAADYTLKPGHSPGQYYIKQHGNFVGRVVKSSATGNPDPWTVYSVGGSNPEVIARARTRKEAIEKSLDTDYGTKPTVVSRASEQERPGDTMSANYQRDITTANDALRRAIVAGDSKAIRRAENQVRAANEKYLKAHGSDIERESQPNDWRKEQADKLRKQSNRQLVKDIHSQFVGNSVPDGVNKELLADAYLARDRLFDAHLQGTEAEQKTAEKEFARLYRAASSDAVAVGAPKAKKAVVKDNQDNHIKRTIASAKAYPNAFERVQERAQEQQKRSTELSYKRDANAFTLAPNAGQPVTPIDTDYGARPSLASRPSAATDGKPSTSPSAASSIAQRVLNPGEQPSPSVIRDRIKAVESELSDIPTTLRKRTNKNSTWRETIAEEDRLDALRSKRGRLQQQLRYLEANLHQAEREEAEAKPTKDASGQLYQGHKGPGIGYLKQDYPDSRDGDGDTVVQERRPKKSDEYTKSPVSMADRLKTAGKGRGSRAPTPEAITEARRGRTAPSGGKRRGNSPDVERGANPERTFVIAGA